MIAISKTYEIVTPESAENGDADERGFETEYEELSFRELVDLMREHPEASCGYASRNTWYSSFPWTEDYGTGAEKSTAIHFHRSNSAHKERYWALARKVVNATD